MRQFYILVYLLLGGIRLFAQNPIYNFSGNSATNMNLFRYDDESCAYTHVCAVPYTAGGLMPVDITFTPDGKLYTIKAPSNIYELDTITGIQTLVCSYDVPPFTYFGVSLETLNDSTLLTDFNDTLFALNLNSCSITALGKIGYAGLMDEFSPWVSDGDMTWYNGFLYLVVRGKLFRLQLNSETHMIESSLVINEGSEDIPASAGLSTYRNDTLDWGILSFGAGRTEIYYIYPETGAFELLCTDPTSMDDPLFCNNFGIATLKSRPNNPQDSIPSSLHEFPDGEQELIIFPNPVTDNLLNISGPGMDMRQAEISVFDIVGNKLDISIVRVSDDGFTVKIKEQVSGMCIVEIRTKESTYIGKVMVR